MEFVASIQNLNSGCTLKLSFLELNTSLEKNPTFELAEKDVLGNEMHVLCSE